MQRIHEYLARRGATLTGATPVTGPEAALADAAADAVASPDARELLRALAVAVRDGHHTIAVRLTEGAYRRNPAHRMTRRLAGLGYLGKARVDRLTGRLHAPLRDDLSEEQRHRLRWFTRQNRWLEAAAAGQVARAVDRARLDVDLVTNAEVRFSDDALREIDVLAVGPDAVVAVEVKSGGHLTGLCGRFADVVVRLGLTGRQGVVLAPSVGERAARDLARVHGLVVIDGLDATTVLSAALAVPRPDTLSPATLREPTTAEVEAAAVQLLAASPLPLNDLIRLIRDELCASRRLIQPTIHELLTRRRLLDAEGAPVGHFRDLVMHVAADPPATPALDPSPAPEGPPRRHAACPDPSQSSNSRQ